MADFKLNKETALQCRAFLRGFRDIIPVIDSHVRCSRAANGDRRRTTCCGHRESQAVLPIQRCIILHRNGFGYLAKSVPCPACRFSQIGNELFETAFPGFEYLVPPLCIQKVPLDADGQKLPTSATCMNLLKLPGEFRSFVPLLRADRLPTFLLARASTNTSFCLETSNTLKEYRDRETMRAKLLYAISANAGFEMS